MDVVLVILANDASIVDFVRSRHCGDTAPVDRSGSCCGRSSWAMAHGIPIAEAVAPYFCQLFGVAFVRWIIAIDNGPNVHRFGSGCGIGPVSCGYDIGFGNSIGHAWHAAGTGEVDIARSLATLAITKVLCCDGGHRRISVNGPRDSDLLRTLEGHGHVDLRRCIFDRHDTNDLLASCLDSVQPLSSKGQTLDLLCHGYLLWTVGAVRFDTTVGVLALLRVADRLHVGPDPVHSAALPIGRISIIGCGRLRECDTSTHSSE